MSWVDKKIAELKSRLIRTLVSDDSRGAPESVGAQLDAARIACAVENAEGGHVADLWQIYDSVMAGDLWLQAMLEARKLVTLNDVVSAVPDDPDDPDDTAAAEEVDTALAGVKRLRLGALNALMDAVVWPVSVCEKSYRPDPNRPGRYKLAGISRVPHYCQDFRAGSLALRKQDEKGAPTADTYPVEESRHIVHRGSMLTQPDNWGGPFRCILVLWLIKTCNREWWARAMERWGAPIPVGKYPQGDRQAKSALQSAFSNYLRLGGLTISDATSVELVGGAATGNGEAFQKLQAWAEGQIQIRVLGQTLSAQASATGLGSGVADLQSQVRDDMRLMDSVALGETLTDWFARPHLRVMGMSGRCAVKIGSGTNLAKAQSLATVLASLSAAGVEPDDDAVGSIGELVGIGLRRRDPAAPVPVAALSAALARCKSPAQARQAVVETLSGRPA